MREFIEGFVIGAVMIYLLLTPKADAREFKLLEHQETSIDFKNYLPNGHSPYMTDGSLLNKGVNLNLKTNLLKYGYWDNMVWSLADQSQFRWVGWNYKVGIRLASFMDVEYEHFSRHILDRTYPYANTGNRFPVEDSINFKIYLYRVDKKETVFK